MSSETSEWLNQNTLIGFTDKRGTAWHYRAESQGDEPNHYPGAVPVADVLRRLFGWEAIESPLFVPVLPGVAEYVQVPRRKAVIRSDNGHVMGIFSEDYEPHPYKTWLLDQVSTILGDTLGIGSAGLLKGGAVAWVSVEVPESIKTPEGVEFRPNLLACTSFDGSLATTYKRVVTNVVCDNTMAAGLGEKGQQLKIKHSRYSKLRLGEAREALALVHDIAEDFEAEVRKLCRVDVTQAQWSAFVDAHVLTDTTGKTREWKDLKGRSLTMAENKRADLFQLYRHDDRVAPWAGTAYGVVQAVNTYVHHKGIVRGANHRAERNMQNAVEGKTDALDLSTITTLGKVLGHPVLAAA